MLDFGVRRTTLSDVARRAGVSRMTLYRRFGDSGEVLQALMTREFGTLIEAAEQDASELPTARERLVETTVKGARRLVANPLFARILDVDPELLLPYVTRRLGATQQAAVAVFERYLADGARDGSIRAGDAAIVARCLERATRSFVLSARMRDDGVTADQSFAELRRMLDAYLRPDAR